MHDATNNNLEMRNLLIHSTHLKHICYVFYLHSTR